MFPIYSHPWYDSEGNCLFFWTSYMLLTGLKLVPDAKLHKKKRAYCFGFGAICMRVNGLKLRSSSHVL